VREVVVIEEMENETVLIFMCTFIYYEKTKTNKNEKTKTIEKIRKKNF
jgi:hypothetical protein